MWFIASLQHPRLDPQLVVVGEMNQCYNPTPSVGFTTGAHFVDDATTMCLKIGDTPKACIFASDHSPVDGMGVPKFPNKPIAFCSHLSPFTRNEKVQDGAPNDFLLTNQLRTSDGFHPFQFFNGTGEQEVQELLMFHGENKSTWYFVILCFVDSCDHFHDHN